MTIIYIGYIIHFAKTFQQKVNQYQVLLLIDVTAHLDF